MQYVCVVVLAVIVAVSAEHTYNTDHDKFDMEGLVADLSKFKPFVKCFLDELECDPVAAHFKKDVPEAIRQACAKCSDDQKHLFHVFLDGLKKLPVERETYQKKYDPENIYLPALSAAVAGY